MSNWCELQRIDARGDSGSPTSSGGGTPINCNRNIFQKNFAEQNKARKSQRLRPWVPCIQSEWLEADWNHN